jgi:expansin (peptidoglycan-binding protein)
VFGAEHAGNYNNGPVDFAESKFHNACAPAEKYPAQIQQLYGPYLAGVDNSVGGDGSLCDACALVKTPMGKSVVVHIVTYGQSNGAGDLDLSPEAFNVLQEGSNLGMRSMTWQLARCPDKGNMYIEYQTGANPYWTSFWVRNARVPIASVESKKPGEGAFTKLNRTPDGPFTDGDGVGTDAFDLRITSVGGQAVTQTFGAFQPGAIVESTVQFP